MAAPTKIIKITPELKNRLKKNFFYIEKPPFPSWYGGYILLSYIMITLALLLALYLKWNSFYTIIFVFTPVFLAFYFAYRWLKPYIDALDEFKMMPSAQQMENWLIKDIKNIVKPAAVEMLSLNPLTITPDNFLILITPIYWNTQGIEPEHIKRRQVKDYFIYSVYTIQIVALTENYISYYTCIFNWVENTILSPYTMEFFFEDISSITSETVSLEHIAIDKKEDDEDAKIGSAKMVYIHNKSGQKIELIAEIPSLKASPRITIKAEKVMQTLRIMLRHRRFGELYFIEKEEKKDSENQEENQENNS